MISDDKKLTNYPVLLLFLVVTFVLFFPVSHFEYLDYDDQLYIINDLATKHLNLANLKSIFLEPYFTSWYPLTRLSHAIEYAIFGNNPIGTHLVNVLLHFLNATVLFQVLLRVGVFTNERGQEKASTRFAAVFASVLFIVHPQHVEAVAWAVQRKELLATLFALLAIYLYLRRNFFWTGVFVTLAMLSKASTVVLPAFFILFDIASIKSKDISIRTLLLTLWTNRWYLVLALAFAAITFMHHQVGGALFYEEQFPLLTKLILYSDNSLRGLYHFFSLQPELFHLPVSEHVINASWLGVVFLVATILLITICAFLILTQGRRKRIGALGVLFYFTALLPVGGLIVFGNYAFGDRYLYFSSIGIYVLLFVGLSGLFSRISKERTQRLLKLLLGVVLFAAFVQSYLVLPKWASTEKVVIYDVERRPDSVLANYLLGQIYFFKGNPALAYFYFDATISSGSDRFRTGPRTASALFMAEIQCKAGQAENAVGVLKRVPGFGGNIQDISMLVDSLRFDGYESCAQEISDWYESVRSETGF